MSEMFFINYLSTDTKPALTDYPGHIRHSVLGSSQLKVRHSLMPVGHQRHEPWTTAQFAMSLDANFSPMIAVNMAEHHPVQIAKRIIELHTLYANSVALNFVTGSFGLETRSIHDNLSWEQRSNRMVEAITVIQGLLYQDGFSFSGEYYQLSGVCLKPRFANLSVSFYVSGSAPSNLKVDPPHQLFTVSMLRPLEVTRSSTGQHCGLGLGICARPTLDEANSAMRQIFPDDRQQQLLFEMSLQGQHSPWKTWLRANPLWVNNEDDLYNLRAMIHGRAPSPYLVGSYQQVAHQLNQYRLLGYQFFLLDYPPGDESHVMKVQQLLSSA